MDSSRLLKESRKTADAEASVQAAREQAKKQLDERLTRHRDLVTKAEAALRTAADAAISETLRAQKRREGEERIAESRSLEREIEEFRQRRERQLQEQVSRLMRSVVDEIRALVERIAKERGFDLFFDRAATGLNGVPFLLYSRDTADFTDDVLRQMNGTAADKAKPDARNP